MGKFKVARAKETEEKIDVELKDLQATLANIEDARPFEDLTVRLTSCSLFAQPLTGLCPGRGRCAGAPAYPGGGREHG